MVTPRKHGPAKAPREPGRSWTGNHPAFGMALEGYEYKPYKCQATEYLTLADAGMLIQVLFDSIGGKDGDPFSDLRYRMIEAAAEGGDRLVLNKPELMILGEAWVGASRPVKKLIKKLGDLEAEGVRLIVEWKYASDRGPITLAEKAA